MARKRKGQCIIQYRFGDIQEVLDVEMWSQRLLTTSSPKAMYWSELQGASFIRVITS